MDMEYVILKKIKTNVPSIVGTGQKSIKST
jgi:hypothetical protein